MQDVRGGDTHLALPAHSSIMSGDVSLDFMWRWLDEQLDMFLGCARLSGCAILFRAASRSAVYNGVCMIVREHNPLPPPHPLLFALVLLYIDQNHVRTPKSTSIKLFAWQERL